MSTGSDGQLRIFGATRLLEQVESAFGDAFEVVFAEDGAGANPLAELDLRARKGEVFDAVLLSLDVRLDAAALSALPDSVRAIATYSVGTDHVDLDVARDRGLAVFNTPGVLADSVAEDALFLMLGAARRATESIELIRSGRWQGWTPRQLVGLQLAGRSLGILGMGDIGLRIADRARALGMQILYHNRRPLPDDSPEAARYSDGFRASPSALVAESDVLLVACPSTPETRGLVDAALLASARPELLVVNIARGDIVNDDDLIDALSSGRIRGAGLDVFAGEPDVDPRYFELPSVFMLPHIGSSTIEARLGMGRILIEALRDWQAGRTPANQVV